MEATALNDLSSRAKTTPVKSSRTRRTTPNSLQPRNGAVRGVSVSFPHAPLRLLATHPPSPLFRSIAVAVFRATSTEESAIPRYSRQSGRRRGRARRTKTESSRTGTGRSMRSENTILHNPAARSRRAEQPGSDMHSDGTGTPVLRTYDVSAAAELWKLPSCHLSEQDPSHLGSMARDGEHQFQC